MPDYFAVHTQPNCEQRALSHLGSQLYTVYFPRILKQRFHARRVEYVPRPFLPRYMFVRDDGRGVSDIKRSFGVHDVVRAGLEPVRVSQGVIDRLRLREDNDGFIQLNAIMAKPFQPGELVQVEDRRFVYPLDAVFSHMRGETRALIFFKTVVGRSFPFEVDISKVSRRAS